MPARTLLIAVGVDHEEADLLAAAEVAARADARLNAIVLACVPPPPIRDFVGQTYSMYAFAWEEENNRVKARAADLGRSLSQRGFNIDVQPVYCPSGNIAEEVAARAAFADVTVIGDQMLSDKYLLKRVVDGALFSSPSPIILFGKDRSVILTPKTILIGWNSTREAGLAIRQSMSLLAQADNVHVAIVDPVAEASAMGEEPGSDLAVFLARHGIHVTVESLASGGRDPAIVLQRHAVDAGADLVVMGAYSHSRLRESVFGGTTQTMLDQIGVPVFMAH